MAATRLLASLIKAGHPPPGGRGLGPPPGDTVFFPRFGLFDHLFIIRAVILRDLKLKHQRSGRLGFLVEFLMPIIVIILHYYVFLALNRQMPAKIPVELYVLCGFTVWFAFKYIASKITARGERGPGVILIPGITPMHFLAATAVWECAAMIFLLYLGLAVSELLLGDEPVPDVPASVVVFFVAGILGTGARLVFEALSGVWPLFRGIKKALTWLLFITSGIYFSAISGNPNDLLAEVSWYNPLLHLIETERHALYPGYPIARVSMLYATAWALSLTLVGLMLNRWLRRWARD